mmetsp:Transcript_6691/g.15879  ORF Transcript_6691/g.15879 Transcript_6691/m.15879 type:complete len:90 (-) Transcript_6691:232-501(-)
MVSKDVDFLTRCSASGEKARDQRWTLLSVLELQTIRISNVPQNTNTLSPSLSREREKKENPLWQYFAISDPSFEGFTEQIIQKVGFGLC